MHKLGTAGSVEAREYSGDLPIKNFARSRWQGASKITGQVIADTIFKKHYACFACPIACGKEVKIKTPPFIAHGPEYETVAAFGSLCLNDNLDSIVSANDLCNRYGIDTISLGVNIAFAMEACEKGLLNQATGWNLTPAELLTIGERLHNLKRMYNIGLGINRKDDILPPRLLHLARNDGMAAGVLPELDKMLEEYYRLRGWDEKGIPSKEKLKQLNLN